MTARDAWRRARLGHRPQKPDLTLDVQELSAARLGGVSIAVLTRAGLVVEHTAGAAQWLRRAKSSVRAPLCNFGF